MNRNHRLSRELEELRRDHERQEEEIQALRYHSGRLQDVLQDTLVAVVSQGPAGSSDTLERAMQVLLDLPADIGVH